MVIGIGGVSFQIYDHWRDYQSVGERKFITTGKIWMKKSYERSGTYRKNYKTTHRPFAEYVSEDKNFHYEAEITRTQKGKMERGSRFSLILEVFIDRNGGYKVMTVAAKKTQPRAKDIITQASVLILIIGAGMVLIFRRINHLR